jgi:DNA-binding MarR family transcriptional regulator
VADVLRLRFDPIRRAAELWRRRLGADVAAPVDGLGDLDHAGPAAPPRRLRRGGRAARADLRRYEALVLLAFSSAGELPMSKIGERLMVHPTSATNIVQRSRRRVRLAQPEPARRRGTLAAITDSGREVMEAATTTSSRAVSACRC